MFASMRSFTSTPCSWIWPDRVPIMQCERRKSRARTFEAGLPLVRASCLSYSDRMTATTISFRANEQTMAELRQLAGDGNLSDAIRELIHAQYTARLYAQAARDAERLRHDPADLAEIKAVNEELDEISAW